jgi:nitric oxide reductase subunit C
VTFLLFLVLTLWTLSNVRVSAPSINLERRPQVVEGKKVWQSYACVDCHTIMGNGAYFAPDLTKVYETRGEKWLTRWLTNPVAMDQASIMPNLKIKPDEVPRLVAFLEWVNSVDTNGWPPAPLKKAEAEPTSKQGGEIYSEKGCSGCHILNGKGTAFGPDLTGVGARRDRAWLDQWLKDPTSVKLNSMMPRQDLTDEERSSLVEYLGAQNEGAK